MGGNSNVILESMWITCPKAMYYISCWFICSTSVLRVIKIKLHWWRITLKCALFNQIFYLILCILAKTGKIQKLICKQNTPTSGKRWQASWNYSTKWANSKGLTRTLECLQSLSSMGEASSLLWVASGGSDGPFGHQRWSPQAAAVILSVWGHDTGLRGCKACCTIYPRLHSGQVWASLSYLQKGHTTYPQRSCEIDVKSNAFAFSGDTAQSHVIL